MTNAPWLGKKLSAKHRRAISEGLIASNKKKRRRIRRRVVLPITCAANSLAEGIKRSIEVETLPVFHPNKQPTSPTEPLNFSMRLTPEVASIMGSIENRKKDAEKFAGKHFLVSHKRAVHDLVHALKITAGTISALMQAQEEYDEARGV